MSLLVILISLALEKLLPAVDGLRSFAWFTGYQQGIQTRLANHPKWQGIPSLLIIVLLPVAAVAFAQYLLNDLLVFFSFIFSIVVLTYCLGPKDRHRLVHQYLDAVENDDSEAAQVALRDILPQRAFSTLPEDVAARSQLLVRTILIQTHDRLMGVLFWFVILGPMGAVLYRLSVELMQAEQDNMDEGDAAFHAVVMRLYQVLAWIPAHLTALSYAVMGSFVHALHAWQNKPLTVIDEDSSTAKTITESHQLLMRIGLASLQFDTQPPQDDGQHHNAIRETLGLCARSLVSWITILALMTLAGWAS